MDLAKLKAEITADPLGRGYSAMAHEQIAASLNVSDRQADRDNLDAGLLAAALVASEYNGLTANAKQYLQTITAAHSLPLTANLKQQLGVLFPAGSATRANLVELMKREGSRGEELGLGRVTPSDVANALRS